jgi:hypothetical protein
MEEWDLAADKTLCFSCEKERQKYVDGLCEGCHQIAMSVSDKLDMEDENSYQKLRVSDVLSLIALAAILGWMIFFKR